jgi:hypothetical protein
MKTILKKTLLIIVLYVPFQSMAWGTLGHRISGQIAESYLTPKARAAVKAILGNESIAMASNWADFIKSDPNYAYLSSWHYIDFDKPYTYSEMRTYLAADSNVDAFTKLNFCIAQLKKGNLSKSNKLLYLHMLIHITEDVHQPLHTGHAEDKGGNDIKVNWFSAPTNLHSVWDSQLIDFQQLSYTEYTASINHATPAEVAQWQKAPISLWIFESSQIANILYTEVKPGDTLTYKYNFNHLDTLNRQLLKGGIRLAGLLNEIFG